MQRSTFTQNPFYIEYVRLLKELHFSMRDGRGESAEDSIRDQMDEPWYKLDPSEIDRVRGMSADLYTLESDSPIVHPLTGGINSPEVAQQLQRLRTNKAFDEILETLRTKPECVSADRAAFLRGWCYEGLGDAEIASLFYDHARKLDQRNDLYAVFASTVPAPLNIPLEIN